MFEVEPLTSNIYSSEYGGENMGKIYLDGLLLLNSYIRTSRKFQYGNVIYTSIYRNKIKKKRIRFEKLIAKIYVWRYWKIYWKEE